jgi:nitroreductase
MPGAHRDVREGRTSDVWEVMRTARAIRRFADRPVGDDVLLRCLEAATWAPSGGNQQPWRFVVLDSDEARAAIGIAAAGALDVIQRIYRMERPDPKDSSARARADRAVFDLHDRAATVPAAVLFTMRPQPSVPAMFQGASIFPAMENFLLAARAVGLGALVTGWHATGEADLRSAVGIPDEWLLAALVVVGWPEGGHGPVRRKPAAEVVARDRWDQGFSLPDDL